MNINQQQVYDILTDFEVNLNHLRDESFTAYREAHPTIDATFEFGTGVSQNGETLDTMDFEMNGLHYRAQMRPAKEITKDNVNDIIQEMTSKLSDKDPIDISKEMNWLVHIPDHPETISHTIYILLESGFQKAISLFEEGNKKLIDVLISLKKIKVSKRMEKGNFLKLLNNVYSDFFGYALSIKFARLKLWECLNVEYSVRNIYTHNGGIIDKNFITECKKVGFNYEYALNKTYYIDEEIFKRFITILHDFVKNIAEDIIKKI